MAGDRASHGSSRRRFRIAFAGVFYALTAAFVVSATAQITQQVFFAAAGSGDLTTWDEGPAPLSGARTRARADVSYEPGQLAARDVAELRFSATRAYVMSGTLRRQQGRPVYALVHLSEGAD